ncbi:MAG: PKD domain-containing protein [Thermoplasmatales archaeon]|nr:MAG: PKD domain-containing protein [Thermoplasmatales archaeon]
MKEKIIILLIGIIMLASLLSGCTQTEEDNILEAIFEYNPAENIYRNINISFVDKSTGENISSWYWDFGDGETTTVQNPIHSYDDIGTYKIILNIIDVNGDNSTVFHNITVSYKPPTADFEHPTENITAGAELSFTDKSTIGDANITSWLWNFGDNTTSTQQNPPAHVYDETGIYKISLTVKDENDQNDTKEIKMSVASAS